MGDQPGNAGPAMENGDGLLPVPSTAAGRAGLAALLAAPRSALIALDFDGTLAPIVADPQQARALPSAVTALRALAPLTGTIAVITGRPALSAVEFASLDQVPGAIVLGHYGRQRWVAGRLSTPPAPPGLAVARERLPGLLREAGAPEGTWVEDKAEAVAVHTRRTADPDETLERLTGPLTQLAATTGLHAEPGRLVIELRAPGADKGKALEELAAQETRSAIMFCGDDLGDRPAFSALRRLRSAGQPGIAVCSGSAEVPELAGEADLVVDGPEGIAALLASLVTTISAR
jgi:trehalose 6-phosphate phosphatase